MTLTPEMAGVIFAPHTPDPFMEDESSVDTPLHYDPLLHEPRPLGPGASVRSIAEFAGLNAFGWTYDTALPMAFSDAVHDVTGLWPFEHGIVWAYSPHRGPMFLGGPFALTGTGALLLRLFEALVAADRA